MARCVGVWSGAARSGEAGLGWRGFQQAQVMVGGLIPSDPAHQSNRSPFTLVCFSASIS
jgi:hypothetical protein